LTADKLNATFSEKTKDIERLDADGSAKFTELDRSAISSQMSYTQADQTVRLRGGERPRGRTFAGKGTRDRLGHGQETFLLTRRRQHDYYTRKSMGDSLPFASSDKPVFVTSESAEFDHQLETAVYTGNARGWQDDNYVRGDRFLVSRTTVRSSPRQCPERDV